MEESDVGTRDAGGIGTRLIDERHEHRVHGAEQHHADDFDGLCVGDAQPVMKLGLFAEAFHHCRDLRPATVDDNWFHPHRVQQRDVARKDRHGVFGGIGERVAPVFDNDDFPGKSLQVRQRLTQHRSASLGRNFHGYNPTAERPVVSGMPSATLAACTAPPEAPLVRLSMAHNAITVPVRSS